MRVAFSAETLVTSIGPGGPGTSKTVTCTDSCLVPKGLVAVMVYSPESFLAAYLTVSAEDVGVDSMCTVSESLKSFPALDHTEVGRGLPRMLIADIAMVSPALTVRPSLTAGSMTIVGASVKEKYFVKRINLEQSYLNINLTKYSVHTILIFADYGSCSF